MPKTYKPILVRELDPTCHEVQPRRFLKKKKRKIHEEQLALSIPFFLPYGHSLCPQRELEDILTYLRQQRLF